MATLGKTATPNTGTHGFNTGTAKAIAMLFTMPVTGYITSVTFWAATITPNTDNIWGVIWDSSGNVLAHGSGVPTSGGSASGVGATQFYTDTLMTPLLVTAGTQIYIGWQPNSSSHSVAWAYNGTDHSPNAEQNSASGTPTGASFAGHTTSTPNGAVAAYATYTPAQIRRWHSGAWVAASVKRWHSGAWVSAVPNRWHSGAWVPGS